MRKLGVVLLSVAGVFMIAVIILAVIVYVRVYRPIGAPLVAIAGAKTLEDRKLQNHDAFVAPSTGELSEATVAQFAAVEEDVEKRLGAELAVFASKQAELARAGEADTVVPIRSVLAAFGDIRDSFLDAKTGQIDAMNRANLSKEAFEWTRRRLYEGAALGYTQLDVSGLLAGGTDPTVVLRRIDADVHVPDRNRQLARPLLSKLQRWSALAFFGL